MQRNLYRRLVDIFDVPADPASVLQGVRPFRTGRPHVRVVLVPSPKNGQHLIPCEGRLEAALAINLEIDPDVVAFRTQPFWFEGPEKQRFVCDFGVRCANHRYVVVDVKPGGQLTRPSVARRMRAVRDVLSDAGIPHRIVTDRELERQPSKAIRERLRKGAIVHLSSYDRERLLELIGHMIRPVGELRQQAMTLGLPAYAVESLALSGAMTFPLTAPWRETTLVGAIHGSNESTPDGWGTVRDVRVPL